MAYIFMAYVYSYGLHGYGLCSYGAEQRAHLVDRRIYTHDISVYTMPVHMHARVHVHMPVCRATC